MEEYEVVVGLEVHCQLNTTAKAFCSCPTAFGLSSNENICPVCLALPGALPVLNKAVVDSAIKIGLALNCEIAPLSFLSRKNYFYPDLPKGYQISQSEVPICKNGTVDFFFDSEMRSIQLIRIHVEEDAGKSIHDVGTETYIDVNRCGVPLLEIVSGPYIRSSQEAKAYLERLRHIIRYLGISDGNMEEGSLRCDANVSIRPKGETIFGTRTEIKNMNSFRSVESAIDYEVERQLKIVSEGGKIIQETRLWDADKIETRTMRGKEDAHDYRYFPEPDLTPILVTSEMLQKAKDSLPELPEQRAKRFVNEYKIPDYDASVITSDKLLADYYENVVKVSTDPKSTSNWIMGEVMKTTKERDIDIASFPIQSQRLGSMICLINNGMISNTIAKQVFELMLESSDFPEIIVEKNRLAQVSNIGELESYIIEVLESNPSKVEDYKQGKTKLFGFFVGEAMKLAKGKANPKLLNELLRKKLET